jgi:hypothetical protein
MALRPALLMALKLAGLRQRMAGVEDPAAGCYHSGAFGRRRREHPTSQRFASAREVNLLLNMPPCPTHWRANARRSSPSVVAPVLAPKPFGGHGCHQASRDLASVAPRSGGLASPMNGEPAVGVQLVRPATLERLEAAELEPNVCPTVLREDPLRDGSSGSGRSPWNQKRLSRSAPASEKGRSSLPGGRRHASPWLEAGGGQREIRERRPAALRFPLDRRRFALGGLLGSKPGEGLLGELLTDNGSGSTLGSAWQGHPRHVTGTCLSCACSSAARWLPRKRHLAGHAATLEPPLSRSLRGVKRMRQSRAPNSAAVVARLASAADLSEQRSLTEPTLSGRAPIEDKQNDAVKDCRGPRGKGASPLTGHCPATSPAQASARPRTPPRAHVSGGSSPPPPLKNIAQSGPTLLLARSSSPLAPSVAGPPGPRRAGARGQPEQARAA